MSHTLSNLSHKFRTIRLTVHNGFMTLGEETRLVVDPCIVSVKNSIPCSGVSLLASKFNGGQSTEVFI